VTWENAATSTPPHRRQLGWLACLLATVPCTSTLASTHWAFQPVQRPAMPQVQDATQARNPIDLFILRKLEHADIPPAREASREVLIRRLHHTLTGLPPTFEQVQAFRKHQVA